MSTEYLAIYAVGAAIILALPGPGNCLMLSYGRSRRLLQSLAAAAGITLTGTLLTTAIATLVAVAGGLSELLAAVLRGCGMAVLVWSALVLWRLRGMTGLVADNDNLDGKNAASAFLKGARTMIRNYWQLTLFGALATQAVGPGIVNFQQTIVFSVIFFAFSVLTNLIYAIFAGRIHKRLRRLETRKIKGRTRGKLRVNAGIVSVGYRRLAA